MCRCGILKANSGALLLGKAQAHTDMLQPGHIFGFKKIFFFFFSIDVQEATLLKRVNEVPGCRLLGSGLFQ